MNKSFSRILFFACIFFLFADDSHAQFTKPGITLGAYAMYTKPKGDFATAYIDGGGAEVFGGVGLGKTFIIGTIGYSAFQAANNYPYGGLTYIPVKVGIKHFLVGKHLFVNADAGFATVKNKLFSGSQFTRGIGAGVKLLGLEAAVYYDGWKNKDTGDYSNCLDFKLGWSFSL